MSKIISIVNQKGGVGKTTTAYSLAYLLAKDGYKVLAVDLDPQANLSISFLDNNLDECKAYNFLNLERKNSKNEIISVSERIDLIPSNIELEMANTILISKISRESYLKKALDEIKQNYDYIIIDTSPSLSMLTINALVASDEVIIPAKAEFFSLKGIEFLLDAINEIKEVNRNLQIAGFLITMYDKRRKATEYALEEINEIAKKINSNIYLTKIRNTVKIAEVPHTNKKLDQIKQNDDYINFTKEFLENEHSK